MFMRPEKVVRFCGNWNFRALGDFSIGPSEPLREFGEPNRCCADGQHVRIVPLKKIEGKTNAGKMPFLMRKYFEFGDED